MRSKAPTFRYRGRDLDEIGHTTGVGGCVRALVGGWGFASFNELEGLRAKVATAVRNARLLGDMGISLAPVEPAVDIVPPTVKNDPLAVPLQDKKSQLDQYIEIIWNVPHITTSTVGYGDSRRKRTFATSEGTYIQQEKVDVSLRLSAMARDGGDVQQSGVSLGSNGDYSFVTGLHGGGGRFGPRCAVGLLKAPQVKGGEYTVVLDPVLAGVFIHEAFGHLSEADHVYENDRMREIMVMGRRFGGPHINGSGRGRGAGSAGQLTDTTMRGSRLLRPICWRKECWWERLHYSRETAATMRESPTGNARAISSQFPPIVRMTNTFIKPGTATFQEIISDIKDGLYVRNWYGGMTSMEQFTFSAGETYAIRNGRIEELMRPVLLSGNLFTTLENLDAVADDLGHEPRVGAVVNQARGHFPCRTAAPISESRNAS